MLLSNSKESPALRRGESQRPLIRILPTLGICVGHAAAIAEAAGLFVPFCKISVKRRRPQTLMTARPASPEDPAAREFLPPETRLVFRNVSTQFKESLIPLQKNRSFRSAGCLQIRRNPCGISGIWPIAPFSRLM